MGDKKLSFEEWQQKKREEYEKNKPVMSKKFNYDKGEINFYPPKKK